MYIYVYAHIYIYRVRATRRGRTGHAFTRSSHEVFTKCLLTVNI